MTDLNIASLQSLCLELTADDRVVGTATGFAVDAGSHPVLVTTWHVFSGREPGTGRHLWDTPPDAVRIHHHSRSGARQMTPVTEPLLDGYGQPIWSTHPVYGPRVDLAALPLTRLEGVKLHTRRLVDLARPFEAPPVMAEVSVVGFPFGTRDPGAPVVWVRGTVATEYAVDYDDRPCFLVDARTGGGQAGSPVLMRTRPAIATNGGSSSAGHLHGTTLVGVYAGRVSDDTDLGMAWKPSALVEVLVSAQSASILRRF